MKHSLVAADLEILQTLNPAQSNAHTDVGWQYLYHLWLIYLLLQMNCMNDRSPDPSTSAYIQTYVHTYIHSLPTPSVDYKLEWVSLSEPQ